MENTEIRIMPSDQSLSEYKERRFQNIKKDCFLYILAEKKGKVFSFNFYSDYRKALHKRTANWWCPDFKIAWSPRYSNQCERTQGTQTQGSVSICKLCSRSQSYRQNTLWLKLSEIDTVDSSTNTEFVKRADTAFSTSVIAIWPLPEVIPSNHLGTIFFSPFLSIFKETQRKCLQMTQRSSLLHPTRLRSRHICARTHTQLKNRAAAAHVPAGEVGSSQSLLWHLLNNFRRKSVFLQQSGKPLFPLQSC